MNSKLISILSASLPIVLSVAESVVQATVTEPDNLIYGNITLNNVLVTAARTDVVVEARRTTNGPAIASYRMGSDPAAGNFYTLRLAIESVTPLNCGTGSGYSVQPSGQCCPVAFGPLSGPLHLRRSKLAMCPLASGSQATPLRSISNPRGEYP